MLMGEQPVAANALVVGLLGPVDVVIGGVPAGIAQPALRALLATLALSANRVVPVASLIDALWQEEASRQRERNLHVQVHQLRRRLAELEPGAPASRIATVAPGYRLSLGEGELDVQAFTSLAACGRRLARDGDPAAAADALRQALDLWRGPALADVLQLSQQLSAGAASLNEQRLAALEDRIDADLAAGTGANLCGELTGLAARFPLRERLRGQLMIALFRGGQRGDALAAYQHARQVLRDELGLDPGPRLRALHQQILAGDTRLTRLAAAVAAPAARPGESPGHGPGGDRHDDPDDARGPAPGGGPRSAVGSPAAVAVLPRQLPAGVRHFTGRAAELAELDRLLGQRGEGTQGVTIAAIDGTAGVGKTALALHWSRRVAGHFPDGQLHVNLRGYDPAAVPVTPAEAIRGFLDALGVPPGQLPATPEAQAGLYRSLLAGRRMLLVLDNARDPGQVRPLLPGSPGCLVVVTSRTVLSGLAAADDAQPVSLGLLPGHEATALLTARLGVSRAAAEPEAVRQIVSLCAGLPLALAITAARAAARPRLPLAALAAALACEQDRLDALDTGEQATSVRGVLSWSYRQLSERAARMFRLLGAHPGPDISLAAAASMSGTSRSQARQMLAELTAASLLSEHQPGRYAFHDLLRAYAAEQARACAAEQARTGGSEAGRRAAVARFLDHYLHTAHAATQLMAPVGHPIELAAAHPGVSPEQVADHEEALAWFRAEHQVLLAVISQAAAEGFDAHAWQLPWTLRSYLDGQGHWQDWAAVNEIALAAAARLGDHNGLGWTEHRIAQVCSLSGAVEDGIAHNTRALAHFRLAGNLAGQGSGHIGLSISLGRLGRHRAALGHARQALRLFRLCGDRIGLAYALHLTGLAHARLGDARQGRVRCQEAVDLYRELGDPGGVADAWHSLASVHHQLGDYEEAVACYQQAAAISGELGDRWGQAYCLINLGDTHEAAGRPLTARRAWQQALEIIGDVHHPDADRIRAMLDAEPAAVSGP